MSNNKKRDDLLAKIIKNSTIKEASIISESIILKERVRTPTVIPMMNVALSGELDGGFVSGLTMWAGPSKHFKTLFSLIMAAAYLEKYPEAIMILYDSEFGSPLSYFAALNIDPERVLHVPVLDIEELKFDIVNQLDNIKRGDKVVIVVDSIGNIASVKEVEDALAQKSVTDMSRAKALKSFFRIATPRCTMKDLPLIVINHTYKEQSLFPKDIVSGGTGSYYNSDTIFILGRQQEVEGSGANKELTGWTYVINVEKSRFVKEKSKILITVNFDGGVDRYSGLLEPAVEYGFLAKEIKGRGFVYVYDGNAYKEDEIPEEVWQKILSEENFKKQIREQYKLAENGGLL